jgi:hypothetical protein
LSLFVRWLLKVSHAYTPGNHTLSGRSFKNKDACGMIVSRRALRLLRQERNELKD